MRAITLFVRELRLRKIASASIMNPAVAVVLSASLLVGCAGRRQPVTPEEQAPVAEPSQPAPAVPETDLPVIPEIDLPKTPGAEPRGLRDLCRQEDLSDKFLDDARRRLEETFCGATLWFDGLLGGEPDIENARAVSGRVELSSLYTEVDGIDPKARLRLRYDLPNLERRVNVFFGRDDRDEVVSDRQEGPAIRSSVFGLESEEQWLAGLGYSPPGKWAKKIDFRVGGRLKSSPEVFTQARYRRNVFIGERNVWRFRETLFWENDDGFGSTTSLDIDHVLRRDLLVRWSNVGTISESTEGMYWRSAALAYHNLRKSRAVVGELFVRGSTDAEVMVREFGTRAIYRQPLWGEPYLFGELIVGYTWPRFERDEPRDGSAMLGFGLELLFGRDPY